MAAFLKNNWLRTKRHLVDWWNHKGIVLATWSEFAKIAPQEVFAGEDFTWEKFWTDSNWSARYNEHVLTNMRFCVDTIPMAKPNLGPGSLCLLLGSKVKKYDKGTVWYDIADSDVFSRKLDFDVDNSWWHKHIEFVKANLERSNGRYIVACPDLIENLDVFASLYGTENLLMDILSRAEELSEKLLEINQSYFAAYQKIYDMIKDNDGAVAYGAFNLWAPGKTAKVQCDISVFFSPDIYKRVVVPALSEQCRWLDYSMYHIDGSDQLRHLDCLLEIEELDALEWTPEPSLESGGHPRWYELYKRILDAGKSVQAIHVKHSEVKPMIDSLGDEGLYISVDCNNEQEIDELQKIYDSLGLKTI
jgi:hypothetical protein